MKNKEVVAMLLAGGQGSRLKGLTAELAKPAVIFGGKYRIIDFALSNCSNSGFDTVGVLTQYKPLLLNSYISTGSSWAFDSVDGGVSILPPYMSRDGGNWYTGTADAIYQNIEYLDFYNPQHVIILSGDQIYKMDYAKMLHTHKEKEADVTISVIEVPWEEASRFGVLVTDENDKIVEFEEKPENPTSNKASMGIYIFKWDILRQALIEDHNDANSKNDFGGNIMPTLLEEGKNMYTHEYSGYWRDVGTIDSYYEANMDLLKEEQPLDFNSKSNSIYSNNVSVQPHYVGEKAVISNSLICDGCTILGEVRNSVLGNDIYVGEGAVVEDCVILRNVTIEDGSKIQRTIIGENVKIKEKVSIGSKDITDKIEVISEDV